MGRQWLSAVQCVNSLLSLIFVIHSSDGKSAKVSFVKLCSVLFQGWWSNSSPWRLPRKKKTCCLTQRSKSVTKHRVPCLEPWSSEALSSGCWTTVLAWSVCFPLLKTCLGIQASVTQRQEQSKYVISGLCASTWEFVPLLNTEYIALFSFQESHSDSFLINKRQIYWPCLWD